MNDYTPDTPEMPTITITLTKGYSTVIDAVDADLASLKWSVTVDKHTCYARRRNWLADNKSRINIHQIIFVRMLGRELVKGEIVDHIDRDGLNNRRENLRLATRSENGRNQKCRSDNTSGYKGVHWHKGTRKWIAQIRLNGKAKHLGLFKTPEEAHVAYQEAAKELFGEFARFE